MKKFIILLLLAATSFGLIALSDDPFLAQLQAKLTRYYDRNIPLKLHVFLNQPAFASGDTLRYKATLVADADHGLIPDRQIVVMRLVDDKSNVVLDAKIALNNGIGTGQLVLPRQLKAGYYSLVAFHPRMIESHSPQFFKLPVLIVGEKRIELQKPKDVRFYPEGGTFVPSVTNRIAVSGPANSRIEIFKSDGKVLSTAQFDAYGWGELFLQPVRGESYRFAVNNGPQAALPLMIRDGITMLVTENVAGNQFRVALQIPDDVKDHEQYHIVLSQSDRIILGAEVSFRRKSSQLISFPKDSLRHGVYAITVFNNQADRVAERLVFIDRKDKALKVITEKDAFRPREVVQLKLKLDRDAVPARVAVTVFHEDLFGADTVSRNSLQEYLNLFGNVSPSGWNGIPIGTSRNRELFLIAQSNRLFNWQAVRDGEDILHTPFEPFLRLSGKAQFRTSGAPVPDSTFLQFFVQRNVSGYETYTGPGGRFTFPLLFDFFDEEEIVVWAEHKGSVLKDVVVVPDRQSISTEPYNFTEQSNSDLYWEFRRNVERVTLAYNQQRPVVQEGVTWLNKAVEDAVGGADIERRLADYLLFPTMHETLLEIIPAVKSRSQKNMVRLWLEEEQREASDDPLYIIDGVVTDNTSYFLSLNPAAVSSIKVINRHSKLSLIGSIARHGIILVDTKIANHANNIPRGGNVFRASGLTTQPPSKQHNLVSPRVPDLRSTLYWNPDVAVIDGEVTVTFPAGDNTGRFRVQIDGITADRVPVFAETKFSVTFLP